MDSLNPLNRRNFLKLGAGSILAPLLQIQAGFLKTGTSLRTPVLNIPDAILVSPNSLSGYPAAATYNANQLAAS